MAKRQARSTLDLRRSRQAYLDACFVIAESGFFEELAGRSATDLSEFRRLFGEVKQRRTEYDDAVAETYACGVPPATIADRLGSTLHEVEDLVRIRRCSYCNRSERQVAIIRGGIGAICGRCLQQARRTIHEAKPLGAAEHVRFQRVADTGRCSFCSHQLSHERPAAEAGGNRICLRCAEFAEKISRERDAVAQS